MIKYVCDRCGKASNNIMAQAYIDGKAVELCDSCNSEYTKVWQDAEKVSNEMLLTWLKR